MSFLFRGFNGGGGGNIIFEKGLFVFGVLYSFDDGGFDKLDVFEMVVFGCYWWEKVIVEMLDGEIIEVIIYVVIEEFY